MKIYFAILASGVALAHPIAAPVAAYQTQDAARQAQGERLAQLITPDEAQAGQIEILLRSLATQLVTSDVGLAMLNKEHPGLDEVFIKVMRPIMQQQLAEMMPLYRADLGTFFATNFSAGEVKELTDFFGSTLGQKIILDTHQNVELKNVTNDIMASVVADGTKPLSGEALTKDTQAAAIKTVVAMPKDDLTKVGTFFASPVGRKFIALGDKKRAIDVKWLNRQPSPEVEKKIQDDLVKALEAHIAKPAAPKS